MLQCMIFMNLIDYVVGNIQDMSNDLDTETSATTADRKGIFGAAESYLWRLRPW